MKRTSGILLSLIVAFSAGADQYYWIGDVSSDFEEPGNWRYGSVSGNVATTPPKDNNYSDDVYFTESAVNKTVLFTRQRSVKSLNFVDTTGWSVTTAGKHSMKNGISASGTGEIAIFHNAFEYAGVPLNATGGTLTLDYSMYFTGDGTITVGGGSEGTVRITGSISGWSENRCFKIVADTTLRLDGSPTFSKKCKHVSLAAAGAKFVFKGAKASAESLFGKDATGSNGIINEYDPENSVLVARELDGDMIGYVEVSLMSPGTTSLSRTEQEGWRLTAKNDFASAEMHVEADSGDGNPVVIPLGSGETPSGVEVSADLGEYLDANTTYSLSFVSVQSAGTVTRDLGVIYTGAPVLLVEAEADEEAMTPGVLRISRAAVSEFPLTVNYSFSSVDAVAGTDFIAPTGVATIPSGSAYVDVSVMPLSNGAVRDDQTIVFSLDSGDYKTAGSESVSMTIVNSQAEMTENVWIAGEGSDNLASTASNWSKGVPTSQSDVLVDGRFSSNDIIWDVNTSVKSYLQSNYTGTVTFRTVYGDTGFTSFSVAGDCCVASGTWTHPANDDSETFRLCVDVGGDFSLSSGAVIDLVGKGYAVNKFPSGGAKGVYGGGNGVGATTRGNVYVPESLGSGGSDFAGGGAFKLTVDGNATIDGAVRAFSAENSNPWTSCQSGSGGSVYIKANAIEGSGTINASAPYYNASDSSTPSGGRIALEATGSDTVLLPVANVAAYGALARKMTSSGAGTVLVKTRGQSYGTLHVKNRVRGESGTYGIMLPTPDGTTIIPPGETWTFDAIVFAEAGILAVPEDTRLVLPGGFASISGNSLRAGILALGGTIDAGSENPHVLHGGNWVFHAETPYAFGKSVEVSGGAAIGLLRLYCDQNNVRRSTITVNGNLTVSQDGLLYASGSGFGHGLGGNLGAVFSHGGMPAILGTNASYSYGSAIDPVLPGTYGRFDDSASQNLGGGALKLTVSGTLTLDGNAVACGATEDGRYTQCGSGGSINISCGSITGAGSISANGYGAEQNASKVSNVSALFNSGTISCTGGGRVSVRLASGAIPSGFIDRITAFGGVYKNGGQHITDTGTNTMCSAGTVYLQNASDAEGCGTVYVRNGTRSNNFYAWTPFPAGTQGDAAESLKGVALDVSDAGRVSISENLHVKSLSVAGEHSTVNLNGRALVVKSARLGPTRLSPGVYEPNSSALGGYVVDTSDGDLGTLTVLGSGLTIVVR